MSIKMHRHPNNPCSLVRGSMDIPVHARHWFEFPGRSDGLPETWCYTDRLSYAQGEWIELFAISTSAQVNIEVTLQNPDSPIVFEKRSVAATWTSIRPDVSETGCDWPSIARIKVESNWPSGAYLVAVTPTYTKSDQQAATHLIIVRPAVSRKDRRLLLITADSTWNAYNDWGGSNHYEGTVDPGSNRFASALSNQRPFARGFLILPPDAPRTLPKNKPKYGAKVEYPHMDWAWNHGYSKKYASGGWASYEKHFVQWAHKMGYPLDIATQQDLHFRPEVLDKAACLVMVGHDEYWSWQMRDSVDQYVEAGGNVARFAGNFLWQIRLECQGKVQICHKYRARTEDPYVRGDHPHLVTNSWEAPEVGRPGHSTFGLDGSRGVYAGWGGLAAHGAGGFTLYRPEHWAFDNVHLGYGDILGSEAKIFGYEVDGLDYFIKDGLPHPEPQPTLPDDLQILAMGLARNLEDGFGTEVKSLFVGDADAKFIADLRYGKTDDPLLKRADRGSGMIVHFTKGKGQVFHAGTTEWVAGLIFRDHAVEQVTKNVLDRFLS